MKLRPSDGAVVGTFTVGDGPAGLAADATTLWVANHGDSTVTRLDRATGAVIATYTSGRGPFGVAFDGRHIWVANFSGDSVSTTLMQ
jgi:YVTN family beta-propeller protein